MKDYCEKVLSYLFSEGIEMSYKRVNDRDVTFTATDTGYSATMDILFCMEKGLEPYTIACELITEYYLV